MTGDGYAWLEELGAPLTNMDFCTAYAGGIPTSDDFRSFGYFNATNGALWINTNGERMANETGADSHVKSETWANAPHNIVYTVFSSEMLIPDAKVFSTGAWGSVKEEFDPYMESLIEKGLAWKADTVEELAKKVGLPVDTFTATIAAYNDGCANGNDPFGRTAQEVAMANGPFYAVKTVPYGLAYGSFIYFQTSANLISPERRKRAAVHHHYSLFIVIYFLSQSAKSRARYGVCTGSCLISFTHC